MRLTIAYSKKKKKRNLVFINNATYQRETLSERSIRQPLRDPVIRLCQQVCPNLITKVPENVLLLP